ncbi:MAG: hypothetical protein GYA46_01910 [candidate division Zixibacteria bacterium]|nr:hypothetical protein [candidate division Zixibacteria bacterium]
MNVRMRRLVTAVLLTAALTAVGLTLDGCKKTYLQIAEEPAGAPALRFTIDQASHEPMRAIQVTEGRYSIIAGEGTVLFIEGSSSALGPGEAGVATMDYHRTVRLYLALPLKPAVGRYEITSQSICELIGGGDAAEGSGLFRGDAGAMVVDSLKKNRIYGTLDAGFVNPAGLRVTVTGPVKAGRK